MIWFLVQQSNLDKLQALGFEDISLTMNPDRFRLPLNTLMITDVWKLREAGFIIVGNTDKEVFVELKR